MAGENVIHVTDDDFQSVVLGNELPVLVDFWAQWCPPCRVLGPVIEQLADHYADKLVVAKCDVDESPQSAAKFNIAAVPTVLLIRGGEVVKTFVGASDKASFISGIDPLL